jgi:hypothetical protein
LQNEPTGIGRVILDEHKIFSGYARALWNDAAQRHGIDYVLENIDGTSVDKKLCRKLFDKFEQQFQKYVGTHLSPDADPSDLVAEANALTSDVKHKSEKDIKWTTSETSSIPQLMALVFASWTVKNLDEYRQAQGVENQASYLWKPHAGQIISILRILCLDQAPSRLTHNLVEIGTGEGKSVTLAITSIILSLLGMDVSCACYSKYLSDRDQKSFERLFLLFGVQEHIRYGTFTEMCEQYVLETADVRTLVKNLVMPAAATASIARARQKRVRPRVLLIDEVDVFFHKDFYGNLYTPATNLSHPTIVALIRAIWKQKGSFLSSAMIKAYPEYAACKAAVFGDWEFLLDAAVRDMISALSSLASHPAYVINAAKTKIGYKEQDSIAYNVSYGYQTIFTYWQEVERGGVTQESAELNSVIPINCGSFSFAEIPKNFALVLGVTGTLQTLSAPERDIVENVYNIKRNTYIPSVFGKQKLDFPEEQAVKAYSSDDYFREIIADIQNKLTGRAVLVFFENKEALNAFYQSKEFEMFKQKAILLTEETDVGDKDRLIKQASSFEQITLSTRAFGRGTDFICRDANVKKNGGVHVIQTYLSVEPSEEKQIKGRTARQGDNGSYALRLREADLEPFAMLPADIVRCRNAANAELYKELSSKREKRFAQSYESNKKFVAQAAAEHLRAIEFVEHVAANAMNFVRQYLKQRNEGASEIVKTKTLVLMDATGSMGGVLEQAKNTVFTMFERCGKILTDSGKPKDAFELQFAVYRNYNVKAELLLQSSSFTSNPESLRVFMKDVRPAGGISNEAVEIGFWHANQMAAEGLNQIILIGDVPPNNPSDIPRHRASYCGGEAYWRTTKMAQPTDYQRELGLLKAKGVRIHCFYVNDYARTSFQQIAAETGGRCQALDVNSAAGADRLTNLVNEVVLQSIGGQALVDAYKAVFARTYV